jgi:hypothetical protein
MALTRILREASSLANDLVNPINKYVYRLINYLYSSTIVFHLPTIPAFVAE